MKSDLLSRAEAAEYLGIKAQTLAVWASTKRYGIAVIKIGRLAKYRRSDLDAFIASRTLKPT
jgi:excisionase family DNA binding protein